MDEPAPLLSRFPDPRVFDTIANAAGPLQAWYALAAQSLDAHASRTSAERDDVLRSALAQSLEHEAGVVQAAIDGAPTPFIARHLWRLVDDVWRATSARGDALAMTPFALPLVIIAGISTPGVTDVTLSGALMNANAIVDLLREGAALRGNQAFTVSGAVAAPTALAIGAWPVWQRLRSLEASTHSYEHAPFAPASMRVTAGSESVHLRFLVGTALAAPGIDLLAERGVGRWGAALTRELVRQLARETVSLLALPRAPRSPWMARYDGLVAQREVSAQVFASNAIRKLRGSSGEPSAVISAHRARDAVAGGELRLSLSSRFEPRDAEGFRCPIYAMEHVTTPLRMLLDLLRDCRVDDVLLVDGVHPETVAGRAMPLFFKPDTVPERALLQ